MAAKKAWVAFDVTVRSKVIGTDGKSVSNGTLRYKGGTNPLGLIKLLKNFVPEIVGLIHLIDEVVEDLRESQWPEPHTEDDYWNGLDWFYEQLGTKTANDNGCGANSLHPTPGSDEELDEKETASQTILATSDNADTAMHFSGEPERTTV